MPHTGVCLNHKGIRNRFPSCRRYHSVLDLVLEPPEALQLEWRQAAGDTDSLDGLLQNYTVVAEDISPDSCLAWLSWLAWRMDVDSRELHAALQPWLAVVNIWETGGTPSEPFRNWPCLHSALAHGYVGEIIPGQPNPQLNTRGGFRRAWHDALRFTIVLLQQGVDPGHVPELRDVPVYQRAVAFLKAERQDYVQSLAQALRLQLAVPLGDGLRRLLVDAYFAMEPSPSGAKKVFIRADREHTFLGEGHSLMGLYRPSEKLRGDGNDITISINPESGLSLKDLWYELEHLENERWGSDRPGDSPRYLETYNDPNYSGGRYDEPWWDDHGHYTIIGAPRKLADGRLGCKLNWNDVLAAVWRCYRPTRDIQVEDCVSGQACAIEQCSRQEIADPEHQIVKYLAAVKWLHDATQGQSMLLTPTEKRVLAALVAHHEAFAEVRLEHLPMEQEFDFQRMNGGFAIIHENGVFLMDDWTPVDLRLYEVQEEVKRVCCLLGKIKQVSTGLKAIAAELPAAADPARKARPDTVILADLAALRAQLAHAKENHAQQSHHRDVREFRQRLENAWSVGAQLEELSRRIVEIEDAFRTGSALHSQSFLAILTMVGLPLSFGDNLAKTFLPLLDVWLGEKKVVPVLLDKALIYLLAYALLGLLGYGIVKAWQASIARLEARQRKIAFTPTADSSSSATSPPWRVFGLVLVLLAAVIALVSTTLPG